MDKILEGRAALVIGAGQGAGRGIVRALAAAGADVLLAEDRLDKVEREAAWIGERHAVWATAIASDKARPDDMDRIIRTCIDQTGRIDILVNNSAATACKPLEQHTDQDMADSFDSHYWDVFRAMRAAFPFMKAQRFGRIINIGSLNGVNAGKFTAGRNASSEAMRALSRTAAAEWGNYGITVNVICPAETMPPAHDSTIPCPATPTGDVADLSQGPRRDAERDIGSLAVFLASAGGGYMNGNTLFVDGGAHINAGG